MKKQIFIISILALVFILGCIKTNPDCVPANTICSEAVPTDELCLAVFGRWFFDKNTNTCNFKSYSGCSQRGFSTQAECDSCKCK